jgi:NTE family protein
MTDAVPLRVFVAMEGGGAKGLVHIGALKALEEVKGVEFCGLAGTSAGAILAALKAAGFGADEIVDPENKTTILKFLGSEFVNATSFLGRPTSLRRASYAWRRIRLFRALFLSPNKWRRKLSALAALVFFFATILFAGICAGPLGAVVCVALWGILLLLLYRFIIGGLADVDQLRETLQSALQRRMFPSEAGRIVRFSDFGPAQNRPTLKIVATNLSLGELKLFSPEVTPDVAVADAVAASICLPVIFSPFELGGELHFDGGLVSNLPAWTFDEERALDPEALTIAIEILSPGAGKRPTRSNWLGPAIRTAVFGAGILNTRAVDRFEVVRLETKLKLLDFDASGAVVFDTVKQATAAAKARIVARLIEEPRIYRKACQAVSELVVKLVLEAPSSLRHGATSAGRVRVATAFQQDGYRRSLRLLHGVGFDTELDTDESLLLPLDGSHVGKAFLTQDASFYSRSAAAEAPVAENEELAGPANRRRRRLLRRDMAWQFFVPILAKDGKSSAFVITIDSDMAINEEDESFSSVFGLLGDQIEAIFGDALRELEGPAS